MIATQPVTANAAEALLAPRLESGPDRAAAICDGVRVTYRRLNEAANRAGWALRAAGCRPGDRVVLALPDSLDWLAVLLGALKIGAVVVPIAAGAPVDDFRRYVADVNPVLVVAHVSALPTLQAARAAGVRVAAVGDGERPRHVIAWDVMAAAVSAEPHAVVTRQEDVAVIAYTSGSTGAQKAAVHTHHNIVSASRAVGQLMFGLRPGDVVLSTSRLAFSFGFGFGVWLPLLAGASTVLEPERVQLEGCGALIARESPSVLCAVPSFLASLLHAARSWLTLDLSSLRFIVSAGEPLSASLYDGFRDRFGIEVLDGVGSTEMFSHFVGNRPGASRRGSCGIPAPDCEIRLVDECGHGVAIGEVGSVRLRSPRACVGYLNRRQDEPPGTGWIASGDRMSRDADGYFYFRGREDDLLKVAGEWVSPVDVESLLANHPSVRRVAVTAQEDTRGARRLVAYIVPHADRSATPVDLVKYAGASLPAHMIPAAFVTLAELPVTPNGKLNRGGLPNPWQRVE